MVCWQQGVRMRKLQMRVEWYCPTCFFSALKRTPCGAAGGRRAGNQVNSVSGGGVQKANHRCKLAGHAAECVGEPAKLRRAWAWNTSWRHLAR